MKLGARGKAEGPAREAGDPLERAVTDYAEAWRDAARMVAQKLPVLHHQAQELDRAGKALDAQRPHGATDLAAALRQTPKLEQGRAIEAMNAAGRIREQGRERDIAREIGLPPRDRDRGMER